MVTRSPTGGAGGKKGKAAEDQWLIEQSQKSPYFLGIVGGSIFWVGWEWMGIVRGELKVLCKEMVSRVLWNSSFGRTDPSGRIILLFTFVSDL